MKLFTIGFTKKSAETFFSQLQRAGVKQIIDVRLKNVSQLSGFAKREDLRYFAQALCGISYVHRPDLAPTQELLDAYKRRKGRWAVYERQFINLIKKRRIEKYVSRALLSGACLVCSEKTPQQCHRRLVAEYVKKKWGDVEIVHIP